MNRVLRDRAMRRSGRGRDRMMYDERRSYPSRRGRDRGMDSRDYYPEYDSRYDSRYDYEYNGQRNDNYYKQYGEFHRPMEYEMYGQVRPYDYEDYNDYAIEEKDYKHKLHEWTEKLKHKDRFHKEKNEIIQMARSMGAKFNNYTEDEFVAVYYMTVSDIRNELISSPQSAVLYSIDWIEDEDPAMKGSEKVCSYLYYTVLGKDKD